MKRLTYIAIVTFFFLISCAQKTKNRSRQFQKELNISTLSKEREDITLKVRSYYDFYLDSEKLFNDKGYFAEKKDSVDIILEPTIRAAIRHVIKSYSSKELHSKNSRDIAKEFYQRTKILLQGTDFKGQVKIRFNEFFIIGDIVYPHFVQEANNQGLLIELDLLNSTSSSKRIEAIEKLMDNGSETAYSLILEHWSKEKNENVRNFILKRLSNNKPKFK